MAVATTVWSLQDLTIRNAVLRFPLSSPIVHPSLYRLLHLMPNSTHSFLALQTHYLAFRSGNVLFMRYKIVQTDVIYCANLTCILLGEITLDFKLQSKVSNYLFECKGSKLKYYSSL